MQTFTKRTEIPAPADELFDWHARAGAFERLTPAWERVRVIEHTGGIRDGARVVVRIEPFGPIGLNWELAHRDYIAGKQFVDRQVSGPFAGENIASARWTDAMKQRIRDSRVKGTRLLADSLAKLKQKPEVFVCASAIGYYGNRGDEVVDETSPPGSSAEFLPPVCEEWEAATLPTREAGIRVVNLRFGVVLSPKGGALEKMLLPFQLGGGGILGDGKQWMSWVALDDAVGAIQHVLATDSLEGPTNAVSPHPVKNAEYTSTLGKVLWRPTILPMPAFAARLAFGQMADELLLSSTRVKPTKLEATNYRFRFPELEPALRHLLGK